MLQNKTISVVIPTLNEGHGIRQTIGHVPSFVDQIVVVDGESSDDTREIAAECGAVVVVEPRPGYGRALKTGFQHASGDILATADGDGTYPIEDLKGMLEHLLARDLSFVSCSRFPLRDAASMRGRNRIGNQLMTLAASLLWLHRFDDILSGMWVFRKECLAELVLHSSGWNLSEEIKLQAFMRFGSRFDEFQVSYRERLGDTKLVPWKVGVQNLIYLVAMRCSMVAPIRALLGGPLESNYPYHDPNPWVRRELPSLSHVLARGIYRGFRRAKASALTTQSRSLSLAFFRVHEVLDRLLHSARRTNRMDRIERDLYRQIYLLRFQAGGLFQVASEYPVAADSDDHLMPRGALYDNSTNKRFNRRLYQLLDWKRDLHVLDLGCSGGGFVRSVLDDGFTAIGLEGSDVSKQLRAAEWGTCPYHLFTCDVSRPFQVQDTSNQPVRFDVITSWDMLEHIPEERIDDLVDNIAEHLLPGGYFIGSVALFPDANPQTGAVYHVTLQPEAWWLERFQRRGLQPVSNHPFQTADYVRGHGQGFSEWDPEDGDGFHLVLRAGEVD